MKSKILLYKVISDLKLIFIVIMALLGLASCAQFEAKQTQTQQVQIEMIEAQVPQISGLSNVEIVGGDEDSLREFIRRWFTNLYPAGPVEETKITFGSVPQDLPAEIPLPEEAVVIATVQEVGSFSQIILDVPWTPEQISEFYAQELTETGWRLAPQDPQSGGFVAGTDFGEGYCLGEDEAFLQIWSREISDEPTDVRLSLRIPQEEFFCQEDRMGYMDPSTRMIPELEAPPGVRTMGSGRGGSSNGSAYTNTDLETDLSADELLAHYKAQLEQAGWQMLDQGSTEVVSWSAWRVTEDSGDEWSGTLVVMDSYLNSDRRFALFSVEKIQ